MWGLEINSISIISVINLIMAIGLVVDYSVRCLSTFLPKPIRNPDSLLWQAHVIHNFGLQHHATSRDEAVSGMLQEIGPPVFLGGLSTFIGIILLAASSSAIFRTFFRMFFGIIVYGVRHGWF